MAAGLLPPLLLNIILSKNFLLVRKILLQKYKIWGWKSAVLGDLVAEELKF